MDLKKAADRFKIAVVALNILLASLTLISLYTVASGAVKVDIPDEDDFAWAIDTENKELSFIANFTVTNNGLYDITNLDIHAVVTTEKGNLLIDYSQEDLTIPSGQTRTFDIVAVLPFERIDVEEWRGLMLSDSIFYLDVDIRANYLWGLSTFSVDETLEYPWEAPIKRIDGKVDKYYVDLIKNMILENESVGAFIDTLKEEFGDNPIFNEIEKENISLRLELWPISDNARRIIAKVSLDMFEDEHTITFELKVLVIEEIDRYDITLEGFSFNYE